MSRSDDTRGFWLAILIVVTLMAMIGCVDAVVNWWMLGGGTR